MAKFEPVLMANMKKPDSHTLKVYEAGGGYKALRKALKDKDVRVRGAAALALGQIDPEDKKAVVEDLIKLLKEDKDETVREGAASGLGALGSAAREAIPALRDARDKATGKRDRIYTMAIQAIGGKKK